MYTRRCIHKDLYYSLAIRVSLAHLILGVKEIWAPGFDWKSFEVERFSGWPFSVLAGEQALQAPQAALLLMPDGLGRDDDWARGWILGFVYRVVL